MSHRIFWFVTIPLAAIAIVLLCVVLVIRFQSAQYETKLKDAIAQTAAVEAADSGNEFLVQGRRVQAEMLGLSDELRRGDSLPVVFRLRAGPAGRPAGLGDERDGNLTPTLSVADCVVTPQTNALPKSTTQMIAAFVWQWSIDDCKTVGNKAVQLLLAFNGPANGSDPVAYRRLGFIRVTDPFAWDVEGVTKVLGAIVGLLSAFSVVFGFFVKHKATTEASGPA